MKTLIKLIVLLITTTLFAQDPIEKTIGEFKELKVYDLIEVALIKSDIDKVVISGENSKDVLINNKNGTLKIKMSLKQIFDGSKTNVKIFYTKVDIIDANEGSKISSLEDIKQFEIDLRAQEGGIINVGLDVNYANIKAVTGGIVEAKGLTKKGNVALTTGGVFKGEHLKSENSNVSINAAGEAYINASKEANITIRAGGDVYVYGHPETINETKVLGGRVKRMNE